jgi:hypothetical protein
MKTLEEAFEMPFDLQILYIYIGEKCLRPLGRNGSAVAVGRRRRASPASVLPPAFLSSSLFAGGIAPACAGMVPACRAGYRETPVSV